MRGRIWEILGDQCRKKTVADKYLSALVNSISVLSYFLVEEGYGDHLTSIFKVLVSS